MPDISVHNQATLNSNTAAFFEAFRDIVSNRKQLMEDLLLNMFPSVDTVPGRGQRQCVFARCRASNFGV